MAAVVISSARGRSAGILRRLGRRAVRRIAVQPLRRAAARARTTYRSVFLEPQIQRLLSHALAGQRRALVIGPAHAVRRALPQIRVDVVGTDPLDPQISIVSEADGEASLPRRWDCVVVTDIDASVSRLRAAVGACLPGGTVAVVTRRRAPGQLSGDLVMQGVSRDRTLALHRARVTA